MIKVKCEKCERIISKNNYKKHFESCDGIFREPFKKLKNCPYCKKDISNIHGGNHVRWCSKNPNKNEDNLKKLRINLKNARKEITPEKRKKVGKLVKKAWKEGRYKNIDYSFAIGRKHSEETKKILSKKRKEFLKNNPDKHPWKKNSKFKSEPCEFLKIKLKEKGYIFKEEYEPLKNRYFSIDIAFPKEKTGIEINGNQHYNKNGSLKKYYRDRHNLIEKEGWKLIEIHYKEVYKENIIQEIFES